VGISRPKTARTGELHSPPSPAALDAAWEACRARWPDFDVDQDAFLERLATAGPKALRPERAAELYLAHACLAGESAALMELDRAWLPSLARAIRKVDSNAAFAADVGQRLRERLLVGDARGGRALEQFKGQGPLAAWLAIAATRLAVDVKRLKGEQSHESDGALARLPARSGDLELDFVRRAHRADFATAFREAMEALDPKLRNVLRLSSIDRLSIDRIAALYGTHRATAARWVSTAKEQLVAGTRARLKERLRLSNDELESLLGVLQSHVEVSVERLLGPAPTSRTR
jgi:RNA polymerase sigma-70 factor (ECF subfamily)